MAPAMPLPHPSHTPDRSLAPHCLQAGGEVTFPEAGTQLPIQRCRPDLRALLQAAAAEAHTLEPGAGVGVFAAGAALIVLRMLHACPWAAAAQQLPP